ncbi:nuclear transport factor 2 family protein [Lysobacter sp. cf310]|uniref:nuclear transport factor 2 family protein n=1 Tax=Lysobacter sp. cf310 TaxID=1761790 RepID=UPI0008E93248|nr:Putative intracellular protease/amidase [Lysobacter sp. cf310]
MPALPSLPTVVGTVSLRGVFVRLLRSALLLLLVSGWAQAAPLADDRQVAAVIQDYLQGSSYNRPEQLRRAFHPDARLYLSQGESGMREVGVEEYVGGFNKNPGQFNGRYGRLISVQVDGNIATAKAEILIGKDQARYVDLFLLRKLGDEWRVISKTAARRQAPAHGRQVLLVVSNADTMPGTSLSAGNSFAELTHAYTAFREAGYGVQFVSPEGGAVPLAYIDTRDRDQKAKVYDGDFMWALANTRRPEEVNAADYAALMYIGGSAAMYGVADHLGLQALAARLYEQQGGVVSAVCHGSAGLANLTLSDGSPLVSGKRVTGYPDAFEDKNAPYYKTLPFSIEQRLRERKGMFSHGARNSSHVEVDGRLITGMNWQSTRDVVAAVVRQLQGDSGASPAGATEKR